MAPRVWITYAWKDEEDGDFSYLVQNLERAGIEAEYDKVSLVPGLRLWDQIGERILDPTTDGWASLLTPNSLASQACQEELAIALDRCLRERSEFPLIGLLHQISVSDAPPALRTRLCVDLAQPNWPEQVKAGLERRPPSPQGETRQGRVMALHHPYQGDENHVAVEYRPRFGSIVNWIILVPDGTPVVESGAGAAGGGSIPQTRITRTGTTTFKSGERWQKYGGLEALTPGVAGYVVLKVEELPLRLFAGSEEGGEVRGGLYEVFRTGQALSIKLLDL